MHNRKNRRIGVIGGGPGGLTLARILTVHGLDCAVYERDEHALARPQGGSLDIHADSGQRALRVAGIFEAFAALARYDDQCDAIYDHAGALHFMHTSAAGDRPEIDRTQLRDLLLASLPGGKICWGCKVRRVEEAAGGRWRIVGAEEETIDEVDLVVGADGAWSRVRPLLSREQPAYTGVTFVELTIEDVDRRHPAVAALVPRGKISALGGTRGLIAQRSSGGQVRAYYMFRVAEGALRVDVMDMRRARGELRGLLADWAPELLCPLDACEAAVLRPIVALPVGMRWDHRPGVTLIGDAAHVMSPFSGEGVNMAMLDAAELALALAGEQDWSRAVRGYEEAMFVRAAEAAEGARQGLAFVSEEGLAHVLEHFRGMVAA